MLTPEQITVPFFGTIADNDYHDDPCPVPSLSHSLAKTLIGRSPRHAQLKHPQLNPNFTSEEKEAFDAGNAAESMLFGLGKIESLPFENYRTKEAQVKRDAARSAGRIPVLIDKMSALHEMRCAALDAIGANPDLSGLTLDDGDAQRVCIWTEETDFGTIWIRSKLDWISRERDLIIDYKTTSASAHPETWVKGLLNSNGDLQPAFYLRANKATGGPQRKKAHFVFLVQETYPPYSCSFVGVGPSLLQLGESKMERSFTLWGECMATKVWPGYPGRIVYPDPPAWAMQKLETPDPSWITEE